MELTDKIVCGDVFEVMAQIPENTIHLAVTSPPYNLNISYDTYKDDLAYEEYLTWTKKVWMETKRVLVKGGRFALNIAPTSIKNFRPIHHDFANQLRQIGMTFRTEIIWYKQTMRRRTAWGSWKSPANPHILPSWEYVLVFSKDSWTLDSDSKDIDITADEFMRFSDGFWYIPPESQRRGHPTPFPEELIYRLIKFYTYKGNTVLDMFGGTGTVAVVAQKTGRHFVHIDISPKYCEIAEQRLETVRMLQEFPLSAGRTGKKAKVSELFSPGARKGTYHQEKRKSIPEVQLLEPKKPYEPTEAKDA
ncbi:MAG: SAM-dependent methyltransferase [Chloroflexi bacterium CG07_land_8_20_14_0_80_45_17]|nr:MAG: SAM-dependent methyltransferase [Chloroflexi bacterium CG23_combo_of_CG06-09_8_20_14_all_45_10]PIU56553.1 MAG: SAM-dependent methyltransferase [Chloroflexi bacterium CG07_land_8_20_14_0_80_45_17]